MFVPFHIVQHEDVTRPGRQLLHRLFQRHPQVRTGGPARHLLQPRILRHKIIGLTGLFVVNPNEAKVLTRTLVSSYPYDAHNPGEISLGSHPAEVAAGLLTEVQERLGKAGVRVTEARISHLAYAPEIASAMLQRQQASAIIAARQKIVEGAVGMVETALEMLSARKIIELDDERRATMVSNLLVVLCSDRATTPVINAGSLY